MFGDRELRALVSSTTTFGVTRDEEGNSELAYTYEDFRRAAEKIGMKEIPSALVLFAMLRNVGFRKAQNSTSARMAASVKTVARITLSVILEMIEE